MQKFSMWSMWASPSANKNSHIKDSVCPDTGEIVTSTERREPGTLDVVIGSYGPKKRTTMWLRRPGVHLQFNANEIKTILRVVLHHYAKIGRKVWLPAAMRAVGCTLVHAPVEFEPEEGECDYEGE